MMERWRARSAPVQEHFESLEPVLALRFVLFFSAGVVGPLVDVPCGCKRGVLLLLYVFPVISGYRVRKSNLQLFVRSRGRTKHGDRLRGGR